LTPFWSPGKIPAMNTKSIRRSAEMYFSRWGKWFWGFILLELASLAAYVWPGGTPRAVWFAIMLVGCVVGPFIAFHKFRVETEEEAASRDKRIAALEGMVSEWKDVASKKEKLGEIMFDGRRILNEKIPNTLLGVRDLTEWKATYDVWLGAAFDYIQLAWGAGEAANFMNIKVIMAHITGSIDEAHNGMRLRLQEYLNNIGRLIERLGH